MGSDESKHNTDPRVGTVVQERYHILRRLAAGGMGVVYLGERVALGRRVAIKFLHAELARDEAFTRRFEVEARAMSKLTHPHCVSIIDFGVADAPYLVMDFVPGRSLREVLDEGPVPVARALEITRQVLGALAHAHKRGIIHRDIKPSNVILAEDLTGAGDHARILDFGLSKIIASNDSFQMTTQTATAIGTPAYMAPEQVRHETVDARSDVYATGILLFELVSGRKPFTAATQFDLALKQVQQPAPRLSEVTSPGRFSYEFEDACFKAMAKDPDARFQSAQEFAEALTKVPEAALSPQAARNPLAFAKTQALLSTEGSLASGASQSTLASRLPRPRRLWQLGAALLLFCTLSAVALAVWHSGGFNAPVPLAGSTVTKATDHRDARAGMRGAATGTHGLSRERVRPPDLAFLAPVQSDAVPSRRDAGSALDQKRAQKDAQTDGPTPHDRDSGDGATGAAGKAATDPEDQAKDGQHEQATGEQATGGQADDNDEDSKGDGEDDGDDEEQALEREPAPPPTFIEQLGTIHGLMQSGKVDEAIAATRSLQRTHSKNAYLDLLMGHLYARKLYYGDAIAAYESALRISPRYKRLRSVQSNVVQALASRRYAGRAAGFILHRLGRSAVWQLRAAAKRDENPVVRKRSQALIKQLSGRRRGSSRRRHGRSKRHSRRRGRRH